MVDSYRCVVQLAMRGRNNFSYALGAKVKKIIRKVTAARTQAKVGSAPSGSTRWQSATGQIRRGERVLFGSLAEKFFEHSEPQCPCKTVGDSWFVEKPPSSPRPEETADVDVVVQILGRCAERARIEKRIVSLANSVAIGSTNKISHGGGVHLREKAHYTSLPVK